jgi:hypothetical protein
LLAAVAHRFPELTTKELSEALQVATTAAEHGRDAVTPRNQKGEATGNTNSDLNRRASLRPYL